ncbi:uncharacterized protein PITG_09480 [Phytophthora infestans T30-4]|uniref:Uncharacterized protein n=1 Tax=Phytophthora infestans (strain T30-4) TaxID=403677 RepID=D0NC40_PHYIT|nr:uncharacterized protein PITG_09480 [Phytophthora infestans T30-4]EEY55554.1 hypothetical protein PITG_09480 [Phytophthora infestans T30-4]|eukprot:XP_002903130.1 hypothetical protein PITG_09480 [Phytophthora infestans T30-4]
MFPFRYDVHLPLILRKQRGREARSAAQAAEDDTAARGYQENKAVDYVRAVQGRAKDYSIDEDCKEEEERANGGDAGAVDVVVNADDVDAVDNVNDRRCRHRSRGIRRRRHRGRGRRCGTQKPWKTTTQTQRP